MHLYLDIHAPEGPHIYQYQDHTLRRRLTPQALEELELMGGWRLAIHAGTVVTRREVPRTRCLLLLAQVLDIYFWRRCSTYTSVGIRQHTSAYVSIRQHTSAYVSIRQRRAVLRPLPATWYVA